jgi:YgiT-type zinc finger domain-containing protein
MCRHQSLGNGFTTLTLEIGEAVFVVKQVPARICDNCGEAFIDEATSRSVYELLNKRGGHGLQLEVMRYVAPTTA